MTLAVSAPWAPSSAARAALLASIERRDATVAVIGLGYVGLPLVRAVHGAGFRVVGYDTDAQKIRKLAAGESYLAHLGSDFTAQLAASESFRATTEPSALCDADIVILCLPTPLKEHDEPDLSFVLDSARLLATHQRPGQLVVLESTTYPGTTREALVPILESRGLVVGVDLFVAYSPEREDPGREDFTTQTIPRLVGGVDAPSTELAVAFYRSFVDEVHAVSSVEVAECAKLLENVYRAANIALVNELKMILNAMQIDVWEVIRAASTKPFGFQPFYPGPGVGGHCVPVDPFYLAYKARLLGHRSRFVEVAGEVNREMPAWVVARIADALNDESKALRGSRVLVIGVAYKPDVDDMRESPAAQVIELLREKGAKVSYHDPHVPEFPRMRRHEIALSSVTLSALELGRVDCAVIVTDHAAVDYDALGRHCRLIVDTRSAMARRGSPGIAPRARIVSA